MFEPTSPINVYPVADNIHVFVDGPDFAVVNLRVPNYRSQDIDLNAAELRELIADLTRAAEVLESVTPVGLWPTV